MDPNLNPKALGKLEDDVPALYKRLRYPFQLSKSVLFAVGSPHTWPGVLAALAWLTELLLYQEKAVRPGLWSRYSTHQVCVLAAQQQYLQGHEASVCCTQQRHPGHLTSPTSRSELDGLNKVKKSCAVSRALLVDFWLSTGKLFICRRHGLRFLCTYWKEMSKRALANSSVVVVSELPKRG